MAEKEYIEVNTRNVLMGFCVLLVVGVIVSASTILLSGYWFLPAWFVALLGLGLALFATTENHRGIGYFAIAGGILALAQLLALVGPFVIPATYCQQAIAAYAVIILIGFVLLGRSCKEER